MNKNLNFIPTPSIFNKNQLNKELDDFFRLIKLKAYFKDNNMYNPSTEDQLFKPKTNKKWRPDKNHHTVETYIEATKNALETEEQNNNKNKYYNNLTKGERKALKELADRNDIIITKADKGGAVVIIDVEDYVKEAEHQLSNKDGYKKLQYAPTQTHSRLVNDTITRFKNDEGIKGHSLNLHAKFTLIEQLSNIHKTDQETLQFRLKRSEDFWIQNLEMLTPKGLNQELINF